MKRTLRWFTLVELLVVITILAIISVVAYQNFGGAVDKAVSGRKINDVSTIETALQQFKVDNNYYPATDEYSASNLWWYNSWSVATPSNKIIVTLDGQEINTLSWTSIWGWKIIWSGSTNQIGAKWTISQATLTKRYLSKDLYDPEVGDIKIKSTSKKFIEFWVGRYVYATYKKSTNWPTNLNWTAYNIAYTIKKEWTEDFIAKVVGDYDENSCIGNETNCPKTLIWTLSWALAPNNVVILDWSILINKSSENNQWVPYAVTDFAQ